MVRAKSKLKPKYKPKSKPKPKSGAKLKSKQLLYRNIIIISAVTSLFILASVLRVIYLNKRGIYDSFGDTGVEQKYPVRGVDVSHHNEFVNWQVLKEENISFVFMKSTEGSDHLDREYQMNYLLAKEVGLKVGTYHFYTFGKDGKEQAQHFIDNSNIVSGDLIPAIDVEHSKINRATTSKESYDKMIDELKVMERVLSDYYGVRPIIYTNKECYRLYINGNFPDNPLWICDLNGEPGEDHSHWQIWQFSHTGELDGAIGHIDLNFYRGTFNEFNSLLIP